MFIAPVSVVAAPAGTSVSSRLGASKRSCTPARTPLTGKERYERQTAKTYQAAEIALNAEGLIEVSRGRRALVRAGHPTPPG